MLVEITWTPAEDVSTGFPSLNPVQKARELANGRAHGVSNRKLAGMFGIADGTVRNLLSLLLLPNEDQSEIEAGAPYRPYLAKVAALKAENRKATIASERELAARRGRQFIRQMFAGEGFTPVDAKRALLGARSRILIGERFGKLKPSDIPWVNDEETILAATQPPRFDKFTGFERIDGMAKSISRALIRVMPNFQVRNCAIDLALAEPELLCESA
jgi:hypothetical protein